MPPLSNSGILGSFPQPNNSPTTFDGSGGILGSIGQRNHRWDQASTGGILAPLDRVSLGTPSLVSPVQQVGWDSLLQGFGSKLSDIFGISSASGAEFRDPSRIGWPQLLEGTGLGPAGGSTSRRAAQRPAINEPYSRPNVNTAKQRASVQGQPCESCGQVAPRMNANHMDPLVVEYYRTGKIDVPRARSVEAVNPQCPTCSARQGGYLSNFSKFMKRLYGFDKE